MALKKMMDETKDTLAAEDDGLGGADANEPRERRETKLAHEDTDRDVLGHASWPALCAISVALTGDSISSLGDLMWGFDSLRDLSDWDCALAGDSSSKIFRWRNCNSARRTGVWWILGFFYQTKRKTICCCLTAGFVWGLRLLVFASGRCQCHLVVTIIFILSVIIITSKRICNAPRLI